MKPSEIISKKINENCFAQTPYSTLDDLNAFIVAVMEYLDEEIEKPHYVCPNCHRIVDELISIFEADREGPNGSIDFSSTIKSRKVLKCKYCLPINEGD